MKASELSMFVLPAVALALLLVLWLVVLPSLAPASDPPPAPAGQAP